MADFRAVVSVLPFSLTNKGKTRIFVAVQRRISDNEPSWLFDCHRMSGPQHIKQIDWGQKKAHFSVSFISLGHSEYITFRTIMPFRKPCHMPFRKLMPSFTLTGPPEHNSWVNPKLDMSALIDSNVDLFLYLIEGIKFGT